MRWEERRPRKVQDPGRVDERDIRAAGDHHLMLVRGKGDAAELGAPVERRVQEQRDLLRGKEEHTVALPGRRGARSAAGGQELHLEGDGAWRRLREDRNGDRGRQQERRQGTQKDAAHQRPFRLMARAISRSASRRAMSSRLSWAFLPLATASSILAQPSRK